MSDFLTIVRAVYSGLSQRKVAATHGVSRNTVSLYLRKARVQGWLTLKDLDAVDDTTVTQSLPQIAVPSRDATFKIRRGKPKVVPSKVGSGVSDEELSTAVAGVLDAPAAERAVTVAVGVRDGVRVGVRVAVGVAVGVGVVVGVGVAVGSSGLPRAAGM